MFIDFNSMLKTSLNLVFMQNNNMALSYLLESVPEQTGPLITPAALPTLDPQQIQQLQMAKKYCQDITNKFVSLFCSLYNLS